jgi:ABC-2 type transport system permease protein
VADGRRSRRAGKYLSSLSLGLRGALEYRVNFFFSLLGAVSPVVIQTALWTCLYAPAPGAAPGAGGTLFGYTYAQMLGYTVIANIVSRLVRTGFEYDLNNDIKSGGLDRFLVKPIDYFGFRMAQFAGAKSAEAVFMCAALAACLAVLALVAGFGLSALAVLGFLLALALAFVLNFLVFWCVGLLGFWLTEIGFLFEAVRIVIVTASGGVFPLSVFGERGEAVLRALPFRFTIQFPTEILCGRVSGPELARGLVVGALWIVPLAILARAAWAAGLRRFVAVGS